MVTNEDVIRTLERVADLLEIKGENIYKVRAYRSAATQVENLGESLSDIAAREDGLQGLPGFGPAIAEKVTELLETGSLRFLSQLEEEVPPTLLELRELPGVGPRTAALLWHEAGITTLDELEAAARSGKLNGLPRLGARTVERIVGALDERKDGGGKRRRARSEVEPIADALVEALRTVPEVQQAEVAGSFRRRRDALGDLDIVVATNNPSAVLSAFASLPQVERVLLRGDTKCSVQVASGFQVDCRAVAPDQFGAALQYFTGSQAHNVRLRGRALRQGLTLNEYGVFRIDDSARIAGATEEDVYAALGLRWIPPEQREDRGEVEAAVAQEV
jgi:DNA polymerase (family 10)